MGMLIYDALVLARVAQSASRKARVLTLGVPTLNFRDADYQRASGDHTARFSDHKSFFHHLGFADVDSLDVSDYEGANIVGDLNDPHLAERIPHSYDLIYDSGTLEHIFEAPTALRTLSGLTAPGGAVVHATPTNGFMDHGFWQVSPDLFRSFYPAEGFSILTSALFVLGRYPFALPADRNIYRTHGRSFIVANIPEAVAVFAARKNRDVERTRVGLQDYYRQMHEGGTGDTPPDFFLQHGSALKARIGRSLPGRWLLGTLQWARHVLRKVL
ncbi:MAG TPA: class I SAM-dependent methyltransferase [Rhizomicrobium sp.]|nr:class I SAM-dependent methyltransferase [Rhizomicrobium sp.]